MLSNADFPIEHALKYFADHDLEVGFLAPTATGLDKSIMDAHGDLRAFLNAAGVHDYDNQAEGGASKVVIEATVLDRFEAPDVRVSSPTVRTRNWAP